MFQFKVLAASIIESRQIFTTSNNVNLILLKILEIEVVIYRYFLCLLGKSYML